MNEFALIRRYFTGVGAASAGVARADVALGIGDDCAVLNPPPGMRLALTTDTLNAGIHFPVATDPYAIGFKSLAVNLSDLAAMGATPAWFSLNLSLPEVSEDWLAGFSQGLFALAQEYGVQLIGGDTTRGPLGIGITAVGFLPADKALTRAGARVGDRIYVTGSLGDAALALAVLKRELTLDEEQRSHVFAKLNRPPPRVAEGARLLDLASACIDISDGLIADLGHILAASRVGARIDLRRLPISAAYASVSAEFGWLLAATHGDDYELCFTLPAARQAVFDGLLPRFACGVTYIGDIEAEPGLRLYDGREPVALPARAGFDHFD